jgi:hypothetical protein
MFGLGVPELSLREQQKMWKKNLTKPLNGRRQSFLIITEF